MNGGLTDNAFAFVNMNAVCTESSYFNIGAKGAFSSSSCTVGLAFGSVTAFKDVTVSVEALLDALVQQPVSVAIEADRVFFQLYSGGVMTRCATCGSSDHWKVEESWGQSGNVRLERSKGGADEYGTLSYTVVSSSAVEVVVSSLWRYTAECFLCEVRKTTCEVVPSFSGFQVSHRSRSIGLARTSV